MKEISFLIVMFILYPLAVLINLDLGGQDE